MKSRKAFTLIELLIVIAIIVILVGLLFNVVGKFSGGDDIVGKVTLKQTQVEYDYDDDAHTVYYVEFEQEGGNKETYATTRSMYNNVTKGRWYKIRVKNNYFMNKVYPDHIMPPTPPEKVGVIEEATGEIDY